MVAQRLAVRTEYGVALGAIRGDSLHFTDVPYGAPPVGAARFSPPTHPKHWAGVRGRTPRVEGDGTEVLLGVFGAYISAVPPEDVLTLQLQTPGLDGRAPVMVWFHPGAFLSGSAFAPSSSGEAFARDGIVHVAVGSRLAAEGYLLADDAVEHGCDNLGLRDQIAALHWVRRNIDAFGGDPDRVTLVGFGSGATSVGYLLASPLAHGLFHRAAMLSPALRLEFSQETAADIRDLVAGMIGGRPTLERLRSLDAASTRALVLRMRDATRSDPDRWGWISFLASPFAATYGTPSLPDSPLREAYSGSLAPVPLLLGGARDELAAQLGDRVGPLGFSSPDAHRFVPALALDDGLAEAYRARLDGPSDFALYCAVVSDHAMRQPVVALAERHAAPAYLYRFDWQSPELEHGTGAILGADLALWRNDLAHALEDPRVRAIYREVPPWHLVEPMHGALVEFVRSGDPGWPRFDTEARLTMRFDGGVEVVPDLDGEPRRTWGRVRVSLPR